MYLLKKEKEEEILLLFVSDSKNNNADPRDMNSNSPFNIFINNIPIN